MKPFKNFIWLVVILITVMSLVACAKKETSKDTPSTNQDVKKPESVVKTDSSEKVVPVIKADPVNKVVPDSKAAFTYSIIDETYTEKGITIKFPQLTKASDPIKGDSINKSIQESIRSKLDSLRIGNEDLGALTLDLSYEMAGYGNKVLSITYQGYSNYEQANSPVNIYHTQNIALNDVHTMTLKESFTINDFFVERFKSGMYSPSRADLDLEKAGVNIKEEIERQYSNKDLISLFQKAEANYKLTEYGVVLSIEVPHALGDHLEMAVPYETIEINIIRNNPLWKDYLFLNSGDK